VSPRLFDHVRTGVSTAVETAPSPSAPWRPSVTLRVTASADEDATSVEIGTMPMLGPGDVAGIEPSTVVGMVPPPGTPDFPPGDLVAVEFDRATLPWMFSPFGPDAAGRLAPWVALVVVPAERAELLPGDPLPRLSVDAAQLPPWSQLHAWAHVEVLSSDGDLRAALRQPGIARARLLCGRRLAARTAYLACVVPAYLAGAQAGLRTEPGPRADPAWGASGPVTLPVYTSWSFSTGDAGTFEDLARRLHFFELSGPPPDRLIVAGADPRLPSSPPRQLHGALGPQPSPPPAYQGAGQLTTLVDAPDALSPPFYGRWHAAQPVLADVPAGLWVGDLNRTPEWRVAAGLGVSWVREHQEELMAACWEQAGEIRGAAARLRRVGAAAVAGARQAVRRLDPLPPAATLLLAAPAASRLPIFPGTTLYGDILATCAPPALLSAPFRRVVRRRGPLGRRLERIALASVDRGFSPALVVAEVAALPPAATPIAPTAVVLPTPLPTVPDPDRAAALALARLLEERAVAQPCTPFEVEDRANRARAALEPQAALGQRAAAAVVTPPGTYRGPDGVMAAPSISTPMMRALTDLDRRWVLPTVSDLPDDTVTIGVPDAAFIEAFLVGLNHEMGRELLWRGFPTDQRGSVFRRFWDRFPPPAPPAPDVPPLPDWEDPLGTHLVKGVVDAVLVIRAALLRRFPKTIVYLHQATWPERRGAPVPAPLRSEAAWAVSTRQPTMRTALGGDVLLLGLPLPVEQLRSDQSAGRAGWFVVFQEATGDHRFGLPADRDPAAAVVDWASLSWQDVTLQEGDDDRLAPRHLDVDATTAALTASGSPFAALTPRWDGTSSVLAHALCRRPFRLLVHADRLLP
jgi:hypothetical protein